MTFKNICVWVLRYLGQLLFTSTLLFFFTASSSILVPNGFLIAMVFAFILLFFRWYKKHKPPSSKIVFFWALAILFTLPFGMLQLTLGTNDIEPIIMFFRDNGLNEVRAIWKGSFHGMGVVFLGGYYILFAAGYILNRYIQGFQYVLLCCGLALLIMNPLNQFIFRKFFPDPVLSTFDIKDHFQKPTFTLSPKNKKNVILVYLESLESTYEFLDQTASAYSLIKPLMKDAVIGNNIAQTIGSKYTTAGMVSSQCGVPLLPMGLNNAIFERKDSNLEIDDFYKNIECLSDKLSEEGYNLSFMNGADARKYSKRSFLRSHGYTRIFDEHAVTEEERLGRDNLWGLNDEILYENLRKEIDFLASQQKPFLLSYLTISTHGPNGYLDSDCAYLGNQTSQIPAAIQCSINKLTAFYSYIHKKGLAENTIFVVMSDHLARKNTLGRDLTKQKNRKNLFFVKGAGNPLISNKPASALDIYPTILELLGYEIKDNRANMGVSLFSKNKTLIETFGSAQQLNRRFHSNHALGEFLWLGPTE